MGERGPIPKRSEERRRTNKPEDGVEVLKLNNGDLDLPEFERPVMDERWPLPLRKLWEAAESSAFSVWYQPSDWALLYATLDEWALELKPRPVQVGTDDQGFPEYRTMRVPVPGAKMSVFNKILASLLFDEAGRRRLRMELTDEKNRENNENTTPATVTAIREDLLG